MLRHLQINEQVPFRDVTQCCCAVWGNGGTTELPSTKEKLNFCTTQCVYVFKNYFPGELEAITKEHSKSLLNYTDLKTTSGDSRCTCSLLVMLLCNPIARVKKSKDSCRAHLVQSHSQLILFRDEMNWFCISSTSLTSVVYDYILGGSLE